MRARERGQEQTSTRFQNVSSVTVALRSANPRTLLIPTVSFELVVRCQLRVKFQGGRRRSNAA